MYLASVRYVGALTARPHPCCADLPSWQLVPCFCWPQPCWPASRFTTRKPGHPWDQARDIFYVRRFSTGEVFEHPHAFAPPWNEFIPFTRDAAFYEQVLARLEAVEKLPPAQMEEQPASRRLIFLRDLWPVFDGLHFAHHSWPLDEDKDSFRKSRHSPR